MNECRYCHKPLPPESDGWITVIYSPTKYEREHGEIEMQRYYKYCTAEHLLFYYAEANGLSLVRGHVLKETGPG
jgi:hypothetical protein